MGMIVGKIYENFKLSIRCAYLEIEEFERTYQDNEDLWLYSIRIPRKHAKSCGLSSFKIIHFFFPGMLFVCFANFFLCQHSKSVNILQQFQPSHVRFRIAY